MYAYGETLKNERTNDIRYLNEAFGYKQIRKTMAFEMIDNKSCNLRSYMTDIASFEFAYGNTEMPILHVNWRMFDCSATTIRHFGDWLRSHRAIGLDYSQIKEFSKRYTPDNLGRYTGETFGADGTETVVAFDL